MQGQQCAAVRLSENQAADASLLPRYAPSQPTWSHPTPRVLFNARAAAALPASLSCTLNLFGIPAVSSLEFQLCSLSPSTPLPHPTPFPGMFLRNTALAHDAGGPFSAAGPRATCLRCCRPSGARAAGPFWSLWEREYGYQELMILL
jgi:hypothetical protein